MTKLQSHAPWPVRAARAAGLAVLSLLLAITVLGHRYYLAPAGVRVRDPLHAWLRSSGYVGQSLGFLALGLFLFLWLYPLRKRFAARLARTGAVGHWLDVHIVAGLLVPLVAAVHASWRFTGLIGVGYASMFVVCLSGIVGRYLYRHIPRSLSGVELGREEAAAERRLLLLEIARATGLPLSSVEARLAPMAGPGGRSSPPRVLLGMARDDWQRRRAVGRLVAEWRGSAGAAATLDRARLRALRRLARREMALAQQARMLEGVQKVFRYWHAAHKPFALTALVAVLLHVVVVVALGATWVW